MKKYGKIKAKTTMKSSGDGDYVLGMSSTKKQDGKKKYKKKKYAKMSKDKGMSGGAGIKISY